MSCNLTCQDEAVNQCQNQTNHAFVAMYSVVCIIGIPLNFMALVVFFCCIKSRSHTIVYMTNLALADLLLVCTLPIRIYYHLGIGELSQKTCEVAGLLLLANMYGSIMLLTCVSIDRCLAVCFPLSSRVREGRKKAPLICLGIWILTVGASLPPYLINSKANQTQTSRSCFRKIPTYAVKPFTLASTLTIGFGIPLIIMLLCSWGLVRAVSKSTAAKMSGVVNSCKIQRMVIVNLAIFLCCFLPYHVMLVVIYFNNEKMPCSVMFAYYNALMVTCLNAILDPLAYYFTAETFRKNIEIDTVRRMLPMNNLSSDGNTRSKPLVST